jgi:hypothetical protein
VAGNQRRVLNVAFCGAALALGIMLLRLAEMRAFPPTEVTGFSVARYDGETFEGGLDAVLAVGDGYAYVAVGMDPLLRHRDNFADPAEASYRAQRPLLSWLAAVSVLGHEDAMRVALIAWNVVGAGVLAAATAVLLQRRGASPRWGLLAVALPGSMATLWWFVGDVVALAALAGGLVAWTARPQRRRAASVAFTLAVLARETSVLVPAVLAWRAWRRRDLAEARALAWPMLVGLLWQIALRARYGAWSFHGAPPEGGLTPPLAGLWSALSHWGRAELVAAATILILLAPVLRARHRGWERGVVLASLVFVAVAGPAVWATWLGFTRPLLPACLVGLLTLVPASRSPRMTGRGTPEQGFPPHADVH